MDTPTSFGLWLRQRRRALDLTQEALAQCAGCSLSAIRKIEADERRPSRQVAKLLADCLEIPSEEYLTFLKIARAELRVDRLGGLSPVFPPSPQPELETSAPLPPRLSSNEGSPAPRHNLPTPPTPLLGREHELATIAQLLQNPDCRLLTLVGAGGIGKTRLAIEAAANHSEAFADGVYFVPLAPVSGSEFIGSTIANTIDFAFYGPTNPQTQLLNYLREKNLLLVLDNLEHLLPPAVGGDEGTVALLSALLRDALEIKLLATSRERLNLQGEWVFEIQGLPVPPNDQIDELESYSAALLFLRSAQRAHVNFVLTTKERPAVAHLCRLVEGMPLGLELAATWVRVLSCREIVQEIERNLDFLVTSGRDVPKRHHSLRAVFDHSWHLLSEDERRVLSRLSVFRGGFTREAAEHIAGATLVVLSSLVVKSLLRRTEVGRYDLHELVRQYAREQLQAVGAEATIRRGHANYFVSLAESALPQLNGPDQLVWYNRLDEEQDNVREVFRWALEPQASAEAVERFVLSARLVVGMYYMWSLRGYHAEAMERLQDLLAQPAARERTAARAQVLTALGYVQWLQGRFAQAEAILTEAVDISRDVGDQQTCATALNYLGRSLNDQSHYTAARATLEDSLSIWRALGDQMGIANSIRELADIALAQGDDARARQLYGESARLYKNLQDLNFLAYPLRRLAYFALADGNVDQAAAQFWESLRINRHIGDPVGLAASIAGLAAVAMVQGKMLQAARLLSAVDVILTSTVAPLLPPDRREYEHHVTTLRGQLGEVQFAAAWSETRAMTQEQAINTAVEEILATSR